MAQIFFLKLKKLLYDLTECNVLDVINAHTYMIKFQKKGLPHIYILILAKKRMI